MNEPHIDHEEATIASFQRDPAFAPEYLNAVIEDGSQEEIMTAFRRVAEAFGMKQIAESAGSIQKRFTERCRPRETLN